jgi:type II secretory ATPase GspE/PulE/Tfp pilus assembly ATPase PilB-like protein
MVLSTLHTNDSIGAIVRLLDLGIPPFLIASSVSAVIAQRLLRRLCSCGKEVPISPEFAALLLSAGVHDFGDRMHVAAGCPQCQNTGYSGRIGVYEILLINEQTRSGIRSGANPDEVRRMTRSAGMKSMLEEALEKAKAGLVSLEEIFRVIPFEVIPAATRCAACRRDVAPSFLYCPHCGSDRREGVAGQIKTLTPDKEVPV